MKYLTRFLISTMSVKKFPPTNWEWKQQTVQNKIVYEVDWTLFGILMRPKQ